MVPSLEIPNAMEKIKMVLGFNAIWKKPIKPAVMINGIRLGIVEITTIFQLRNNKAIKMQINMMAVIVLSIKFVCR